MFSPNHNARPKGTAIDTVVLHYTGMPTAEAALARLCDPATEVSAHYVILEDGEIIPLVREDLRAWHAGVSHWRGRENINDTSIGIELANPGHEYGYRAFSEAQVYSALRLCQELMERHPIEARNVVGHSDIAPTRKQDPGELFPWEFLASNGIGLWPDMPLDIVLEELLRPGDESKEVKRLQERLTAFGYKMTQDGDGAFGVETIYVVTAFQRHFSPHRLDGVWDTVSQEALEQLLLQVG